MRMQRLPVTMTPYTKALIETNTGAIMDTSLTRAITKLAKGEILRVDKAIGQSIAVVRGMVWVTQEGDLSDTFLSAGDSFVFSQRGTALAQAITDTQLIAFVGETAEVIETAPVSAK